MRSVDGADKSEYTFGPGVALDLSDDDPDDEPLALSARDLRKSLALLLLERRPVVMYGKRSFMRSDFGVSALG